MRLGNEIDKTSREATTQNNSFKKPERKTRIKSIRPIKPGISRPEGALLVGDVRNPPQLLFPATCGKGVDKPCVQECRQRREMPFSGPCPGPTPSPRRGLVDSSLATCQERASVTFVAQVSEHRLLAKNRVLSMMKDPQPEAVLDWSRRQMCVGFLRPSGVAALPSIFNHE